MLLMNGNECAFYFTETTNSTNCNIIIAKGTASTVSLVPRSSCMPVCRHNMPTTESDKKLNYIL